MRKVSKLLMSLMLVLSFSVWSASLAEARKDNNKQATKKATKKILKSSIKKAKAKVKAKAKAKAKKKTNQEVITAKVFERENNTQIFRMHKVVEKKEGDKRYIVTKYYDMKNKLVLEEYVNTDGEKLVNYRRKQHQVGELTSIHIDDKNKVHFLQTENGETKKDNEDWKPGKIVTAQLSDHVRRNWHKIEKGEDIEFRVMVPSRLDSVGFYLTTDRKVHKINGKNAYKMKMKASSFFIRGLVDTIVFFYEKDGDHKLLKVNGRLPLKKLTNGRFRDWDGILVVD